MLRGLAFTLSFLLSQEPPDEKKDLERIQKEIIAENWTSARDLIFRSIKNKPFKSSSFDRMYGFYQLLPDRFKVQKTGQSLSAVKDLIFDIRFNHNTKTFDLNIFFQSKNIKNVTLRSHRKDKIHLIDLKKGKQVYNYLIAGLPTQEINDLYELKISFLDGSSQQYTWLIKFPYLDILKENPVSIGSTNRDNYIRIDWSRIGKDPLFNGKTHKVSHTFFTDRDSSLMVWSEYFPMSKQSHDLRISEFIKRTENDTYYLNSDFATETDWVPIKIRYTFRFLQEISLKPEINNENSPSN